MAGVGKAKQVPALRFPQLCANLLLSDVLGKRGEGQRKGEGLESFENGLELVILISDGLLPERVNRAESAEAAERGNAVRGGLGFGRVGYNPTPGGKAGAELLRAGDKHDRESAPR